MKCGSFIRLDFYRPHSQLIWLLLVVNAFSAPHFDWLVGRTNDFGEPFHFNKYYDYTTVWPQNFYVFNVGNENKKLTEINSSRFSFDKIHTHKKSLSMVVDTKITDYELLTFSNLVCTDTNTKTIRYFFFCSVLFCFSVCFSSSLFARTVFCCSHKQTITNTTVNVSIP